MISARAARVAACLAAAVIVLSWKGGSGWLPCSAPSAFAREPESRQTTRPDSAPGPAANNASTGAHGDNARASAPIGLRLRFDIGPAERYRVTNEQRISDQGAHAATVRTRSSFELLRQVGESSDDATGLTFKFERIEWSIRGGDGDFQFDSNEPPPGRGLFRKASEPEEAAALRKVIGKSFRVAMTSAGKIVDISGVETDAPSAPSPGSDSRASDLPASVQALIGRNQLQQLLQSQYSWLPPHPVRVGETWQRVEMLDLGVCIAERRNTTWIEEVDADVVSVKSRIEISSSPSAGLTGPAGRVRAEIIPQQPGLASIRFNRRTGLLESLDADVSYLLKLETESTRPPNRKSVQTKVLRATTNVERIMAKKPL